MTSMLELSITQMAAQMNVSERTALRYISAGWLNVEKTARGKYRVAREELDQLKKYEPDEIAELREEISQLRQEVERLSSEVQELREPRRPGATVARAKAPQISTPSMVTARSFGEIHGIKRDQMHSWIVRGFFPATSVGLNGRLQYRLDPEQQAGFIRWMQGHNVSFQPCPQCPHEPLG